MLVHHQIDPRDGDEVGYLPLDPAVRELLGPRQVEYASFTVVPAPVAEIRSLVQALADLGMRTLVDTATEIDAFGAPFDPLRLEGRRDQWADQTDASVPLSGLAWVQFAYPIKGDWYQALADCFVDVLVHTRKNTVLVSSASLDDVLSCEPISGYLAAVEPVLSTDRAAPSVLEADVLEATLAPGVIVEDLYATVPQTIRIERAITAAGARLETARLIGHGAGEALLGDSRVVRLVPAGGVSRPSDERQAHILARRWEINQGEPLIPVLHQGSYSGTYQGWLIDRDLFVNGDPSEYEQTIAIFDSGIDDGVDGDITPDTSTFHPDLTGAILGAMNITMSPPQYGFGTTLAEDRSSHGTSVFGTAIGRGVDDGRGTGQNTFAAGLGIAPQAGGLSIKRWTHGSCTIQDTDAEAEGGNLELAHHQARVGGLGAVASIANHSWNKAADVQNGPGWRDYEALANRFEALVRDASIAGNVDPMTIVFSAGNKGNEGADSIGRPANAKNVITVGSVDSWDPAAQDTCWDATGGDPIDGPFVVSSFSGRGRFFGPNPPPPGDPVPQLHETRIKPDVVAPGWRVEGPRRETPPTGCPTGPCYKQFNPAINPVTIAGPPTYAYGRGTSFSAPAISGALAQKSKQLRDPSIMHPTHPPWTQVLGIEPTPTLLKAAVVATARSLGQMDSNQTVLCTNDDCRPSNDYGWGLVDLDRLTHPDVHVFLRNEQGSWTQAGQSWTSPPLLADSLGEEVVIALVWNDVPSNPPTEALQRDLHLSVTEVDGSTFYVGNNFNENMIGDDDGYSYGFSLFDWSVPDGVNNVELVALPKGRYGPKTTRLRIHVSSLVHDNPIGTSFPSQSFSVYAWNVRCWKTGTSTCLNQ